MKYFKSEDAKEVARPFSWSKSASNEYKIKKLQSRVNKLTPEIKTKEFSFVGTPAAGALFYVPLFTIAEGLGEDERIGDKITVKSIEIRGASNVNGSLPADMYIVCNEDPNLTPAIGHFIFTAGGHYLVNQGKEIYHKYVDSGSWDQSINYKKYFKNLVVKYRSTTTGALLATNNYCFVVVNRSAASTLSSEFSIKIRYTDN